MSTAEYVASAHPLQLDDPPRIGRYRLLERLLTDDAAVVFRGLTDDRQVAVVLLTAGAHSDAAARGRFRRAVDDLLGRSPESVDDSDFDPEIAPWIAIPLLAGQLPETVPELLAAVTMRQAVSPASRTAGPDFAPHWHPRHTPGRWRLWPLPWPAVGQAASRAALLWALALVMLLATVAVLIAIWLFHHQPPSRVPLPQNSPIPSSPPSSGASPTTPSNTSATHSPPNPSPTFTNSGGLPTIPPV
jgi:hypothetical protein